MNDLILMVYVNTILALIIVAFLIKSLIDIDEDKEDVMNKKIAEIQKEYVTLCKRRTTMNNITPKEAIANLNHLYGMVAPDIQRSLDVAIKALEEKRPKGKWVAREDMDYIDENKVVHNHFMCNKCGLIHDFIDEHTSQYNFCPNCGADMRGGAE